MASRQSLTALFTSNPGQTVEDVIVDGHSLEPLARYTFAVMAPHQVVAWLSGP